MPIEECYRPEGFDEDLYLLLNPDLKESGANPLLHYWEFGRKEGRKFTVAGEHPRSADRLRRLLMVTFTYS